jgi:hypothetical protein
MNETARRLRSLTPSKGSSNGSVQARASDSTWQHGLPNLDTVQPQGSATLYSEPA